MQKEYQKFFLPLSGASSQGLYPPCEVPVGGGRIGFVNAPRTSSEVRDLKKELKPLLEDLRGRER
jgi:hypothetical protein